MSKDRVFIEDGKMTPQVEQWVIAVLAVAYAAMGIVIDNIGVRILCAVMFLGCVWVAGVNHRIAERQKDGEK